MSNRYGEELPSDITEREMYNNMLIHQTVTKASFLLGGSLAVAFNLYDIFSSGFSFYELLAAVFYFAAGSVLFFSFYMAIFSLRHFEVHPLVIYLTAALGPIVLSLFLLFYFC